MPNRPCRALARLLPALLLAAAPARAHAAPLEAATRRALVERVADLLEKNYVFADTASLYARTLRGDLKARRFDPIADDRVMAEALNARLQAVHPDGHLRISPPDPSTPLPPAEIRIAPGPREVPDTLALDSLDAGQREYFLARRDSERRVNHYFRRAEVLPGNVGLIEIDQVGFLFFSKRAADAALAFVAECDALILDLRDNPGGAEGLNQYLVSQFFPADSSVHLYSRYSRPGVETREIWSRTGPRPFDLSRLPLYVLTSGRTGSAAENISFTLQGLHRATLVGERTAGGAHSSVQVGLPGGFRMILPISRAFDPRTGRDWERVGVIPEVACHADSALAVAHGLALDALAAGASDGKRRQELARARAQFRAEHPLAGPVPIAVAGVPGAAAPAAAEGATPGLSEYEATWGARRTWVEGGKLWLQRTGDPARSMKLELIPSGKDEFVVDRVGRPVQFVRDSSARVVAIRVQTPTDAWEESPRTTP